ncbi:gp436 family protein [Pandoraea apista]|uniref:gp436 family protein n=1 Tax=Pandoraea apista TaxID=93218 RepID=UPI000F67CFF0|nr:phage protein Gp36 family protein [Pandoraea apista]RRW89151.1 DUF1320 domain-containing protein [Pandoraea apista]RRW98945.1 DUF1320 domain-containing protein [Pandoraea apista]
MSYASREEMIDRFGELEVIQLTDRDRRGEIDASVLAYALEDASAEMNTYLAGRYQVPVKVHARFLAGLCCDIARYRMSGSETVETDPVRVRYKDALRFLEKVANGTATLGLDVTDAPIEAENTVLFDLGTRLFSDSDPGGI